MAGFDACFLLHFNILFELVLTIPLRDPLMYHSILSSFVPQFWGMMIALTDIIMILALIERLQFTSIGMDLLVNSVIICTSILRNDDTIGQYIWSRLIENLERKKLKSFQNGRFALHVRSSSWFVKVMYQDGC